MSIVLSQAGYGKSEIRLVKVSAGRRSRPTRSHGRRRARGRLRRRVHRGGQHRPACHRHHAQHGLRARQAISDRPHRVVRPAARRALRRGRAGRYARECARRRAPVGQARGRWSPHAHRAFQRGSGGNRVATVVGDGGEPQIESGIDDLLVRRRAGLGTVRAIATRRSRRPSTGSWRRSSPRGGRTTDATSPSKPLGVKVRAISELFGMHHSRFVDSCLHHGKACSREPPGQQKRTPSSRCPTSTTCCTTSASRARHNENGNLHATNQPHAHHEGTVERSPE